MSDFTRKVLRLIAGIAVSVGILLSLDYLPWSLDVTDFGPVGLLFSLAGMGAVSMFVASAAGAFIARSSFIGPAVLLALCVWYLLISFLRAWSDKSGLGGLVSFWLPGVGSLLIMIGSATLGAWIGRRFHDLQYPR